MAYAYKYPRPAVTVDAVVFGGNVIVKGGGAVGEVLTLGSVKALTLKWGNP